MLQMYCATCNKSINPESKPPVSLLNHTYHTECTTCYRCKKHLWSSPFIKKQDGKLFCEDLCSEEAINLPPINNNNNNNNMNGLFSFQNETRLINNGESLPNKDQKFLPTAEIMKRREIIGKNQPLMKNDSFKQTNKPVYMYKESNNEIVSYCDKCNKFIEDDKEKCTHNDQTFHKSCFRCVQCLTELYKMKNVYDGTKTNEFYCEPCYNKNFGPKCPKCNEPIASYMLTTTHENKLYHKECFICQRCKKYTNNEKFINTGKMILCRRCY